MININDLKPGMEIKLRNDLEDQKYYGDKLFNKFMVKDRLVNVRSISKHGNYFYIYQDTSFVYTSEMIEYIKCEKYIQVHSSNFCSSQFIYKSIREYQDYYYVIGVSVNSCLYVDKDYCIEVNIKNEIKIAEDEINKRKYNQRMDKQEIQDQKYIALEDIKSGDVVKIVDNKVTKVIKWKEVDYNTLFLLKEPTKIKIFKNGLYVEGMFCAMFDSCLQCSFYKIGYGKCEEDRFYNLATIYDAEKIEIEVNKDANN